MKVCCRCKSEKENTEFYKDKRKKDGIGSICKKCDYLRKDKKKENERRLKYYYENHEKNKEKKKLWKREYDKNNREYVRERGRFFYHKNIEKNRQRQNELSRNPERRKKIALWMKSYRIKKYSIQKRANSMVEHAVKMKYLVKPNKCEKCLKECKPDGHHDDYNKPLEVRWLCKICHAHQHNKLMDVKP